MRIVIGSMLSLLMCCLAVQAEMRTFTDAQGRQIQAEMIGVNGNNVVMKKNGRLAQWPIHKLSRPDQAYAMTWKKQAKSPPKIQVRIWEREGIGEKGVINEQRLESSPGKNIPLLKQTEEKASYRHYDVDLHNNSQVDASKLILAYVLYVITPSRQVVSESDSETIELIAAGSRHTEKTRGITYVRSKVTSTTLGTNLLGNLQIGSDTDRSKETFGGIWVRVLSGTGEVIGEAKDLNPVLEKMNPEWVGESSAPTLPVASSFQQLEDLLKPLKQLIENLPQQPPAPPGLPDSPPKPPRPFPPGR